MIGVRNRCPPLIQVLSQPLTPLCFAISQDVRIHMYFFLFFLEYDCFTMLCYFLLYNNVNQAYVCVCVYIYIYLPF